MFDESEMDTTGEPGAGSTKLPKLHWCCYRGDAIGVLEWITQGGSLQETISLKNQHNKIVCGISPLFLAAQRGHMEVAKLLVENGANASTPCFIQGSTEICTPREVASLNLHYKLARYLKRAIRQRRREDAFLNEDDDDNMSMASGASSMRSVMTRTVQGIRPAASAQTPQPPSQALTYMENIDLSTFDPDNDTQPRGSIPAPRRSFFCCGSGSNLPIDHHHRGQPIRPNPNANQRPVPNTSNGTNSASSGMNPPSSGMGGTHASTTANGGNSNAAGNGNGNESTGAPVGGLRTSFAAAGGSGSPPPAATQRESSKTTHTLDRYLKDLDLETWAPE